MRRTLNCLALLHVVPKQTRLKKKLEERHGDPKKMYFKKMPEMMPELANCKSLIVLRILINQQLYKIFTLKGSRVNFSYEYSADLIILLRFS